MNYRLLLIALFALSIGACDWFYDPVDLSDPELADINEIDDVAGIF